MKITDVVTIMTCTAFSIKLSYLLLWYMPWVGLSKIAVPFHMGFSFDRRMCRRQLQFVKWWHFVACPPDGVTLSSLTILPLPSKYFIHCIWNWVFGEKAKFWGHIHWPPIRLIRHFYPTKAKYFLIIDGKVYPMSYLLRVRSLWSSGKWEIFKAMIWFWF